MFNSAGAAIGFCIPTATVDPPGAFDWELRFDSATKIPGFAYFASTIVNGSESGCDQFTAAWTPGSADRFFLDGDVNPHVTVIQEFRTEDRP
jgi:hypothetical protein